MIMRQIIDFLKKHKDWCLLFLILSAGIFLRVFRLGEIPGGYHRDEAYGAWNALSLYKDGIDSAGYSYPVYFEAWAHGQNALNSYLMLPLIFLSGGHITPLVVRLPQVIVSIASLLAIYSMMKRMYSQPAALWALFLAAICPWHVMMSRWGLESNLAPGFLILGLFFWIKGLDNPRFLPLSALCYGLSLYCYATIWPIVPVMILLQIVYSFVTGKLKCNRWFFSFGLILVALGLPLVLFLLVNMELLPTIKIGCFSIYKMTSFRSGELATSLSEILSNIRNVLRLLVKQDIGRPYDVIMPYGFFYDIGRIFICIGVLVILARTLQSFAHKEFSYDFFIFTQLIGAGIVGCLVTVTMTQINCLYLPLILCEAIGILFTLELLSKGIVRIWNTGVATKVKHFIILIILGIYLVNLTGFQIKYYTSYKDLASAHFQEGADDAVRFALEQARQVNSSVYVNAGLKYPNVLLATETGAKEYLETLVYSENLPAPSRFDCDGVTFYMGINFNNINQDEIYLLYYTEVDYFSDFNLTKFCDWYVAIPQN